LENYSRDHDSLVGELKELKFVKDIVVKTADEIISKSDIN
jgi:uncharacterized protein YlbG (UPF0298 family)